MEPQTGNTLRANEVFVASTVEYPVQPAPQNLDSRGHPPVEPDDDVEALRLSRHVGNEPVENGIDLLGQPRTGAHGPDSFDHIVEREPEGEGQAALECAPLRLKRLPYELLDQIVI